MGNKQTIDLGTIQLSYRSWGDRQGEPLLLLHGMADHGGVWGSLGTALGDRYAVVAPDLRGHGDSSKPPKGYQFADYITDLGQLMAALGWQSAHILGHSWSAKLAAIWATQQRDRFRSLILVDPFFMDRMPKGVEITFPLLYRVLPFLKLVGHFASYTQAEAIAQSLKQYQGWSDLQQQVFRESLIQNPDGTCQSKFVLPARDEIFSAVMTEAGLTQPLSLPSLLVLPEKGLNRMGWQTASIRKFLTPLQISSVPGNHWCHLVQPEAFELAIASFLAAQTSLKY
jgi:pimeloyl-ACP methyl ester carboxylesterase